MNETWLPVVEYESLYEVSSFGNVRSLNKLIPTVHSSYRNIKGKTLKPRLDSGKRYLLIDFTKDGVRKTHLLHRIVAFAHIQKPFYYPEVNHKDGNTKNNNINNLEWTSRSKNEIHKYRELKIKHPFTGRVGKLHARSKPVIQVDLKSGNKINEYESSNMAEKDGFDRGAISLCCNKKRISHKGYRWSFK